MVADDAVLNDSPSPTPAATVPKEIGDALNEFGWAAHWAGVHSVGPLQERLFKAAEREEKARAHLESLIAQLVTELEAAMLSMHNMADERDKAHSALAEIQFHWQASDDMLDDAIRKSLAVTPSMLTDTTPTGAEK